MTERITMDHIPAEMAEACFAQSQMSGCGPHERCGELTQIGFVTNKKTAAVEGSHQWLRITSRDQGRLETTTRSQARLNSQIGRLHSPPVGAAENPLRLVPQSPQAFSHRKRSLRPEHRQGAIGVVLPLLPFHSDAVTQQEQINRSGDGHADAGCSSLHSDSRSDQALPPG